MELDAKPPSATDPRTRVDCAQLDALALQAVDQSSHDIYVVDAIPIA